jgi:hypothetical protein
MKILTDHDVFLVDVLDHDGQPTGTSVSVEATWAIEISDEYADADGRRGVPWQTVDLLDVFVPAKSLMGLDSRQVEQIVRDTKHQIERRNYAPR